MEKLQMETEDFAAMAQMLRKVDFFAPLTVAQLEVVLPYIQLYSCAAEETIFKQGAAGDAFYIVYKGQVGVFLKKGFLSSSKKVSTLGPGDVFGEMALLSKSPRSATIRCLEPARLFVLLAQDFNYILDQNHAFAAEMDKIAAQRKFASEHAK